MYLQSMTESVCGATGETTDAVLPENMQQAGSFGGDTPKECFGALVGPACVLHEALSERKKSFYLLGDYECCLVWDDDDIKLKSFVIKTDSVPLYQISISSPARGAYVGSAGNQYVAMPQMFQPQAQMLAMQRQLLQQQQRQPQQQARGGSLSSLATQQVDMWNRLHSHLRNPAAPAPVQVPRHEQEFDWEVVLVCYKFNSLVEVFVSTMRFLQMISCGEALHLAVCIRRIGRKLEANYGPRDFPYVAEDPPPVIDTAGTLHECEHEREATLGYWRGTEGAFMSLCERARVKYSPSSYNCWTNNCISFAADFLTELGLGERMPPEFLVFNRELATNEPWWWMQVVGQN